MDLGQLLSSVRTRTTHRGISTAAPFLRELGACLGGTCPSKILTNVSGEQWASYLKAAENQLVYADDDMDFLDLWTKGQDGSSLPPHTIAAFSAVVTTTKKDRDGDVLETEGAQLDPSAPLLWQHLPTEPIGRLLKEGTRGKKRLPATFSIAATALGQDAALLAEHGALRISHGFLPDDDGFEPLDEKDLYGGYHITKFKILEVSLVSVPSNPDAVITQFSREKLAHPLVKAWAGAKFASRTAMVPVEIDVAALSHKDNGSACICSAHEPAKFAPVRANKNKLANPPRWNKSLSEAFDVASEEVPPATLFYEWATKYLGVPVKKIYKFTTFVPSARMGSFLSAWKQVTLDYDIDDVRNLGHNSEAPPVYEMIQLNSTKSADFLIDGTAFLHGEIKLCAEFQPDWRGLYVTLYARFQDRDDSQKLIVDTWETAYRDFNFLKGEAFSLSGDFLPRGEETWDDVFLTDKNKKALTRSVDLLNQKQEQCANRGIVLLGPPGTGKTLAGRIIKNTAEATFIWVAARDFYYMGSFGGIAYAFDLARELAPAILFVEDVDNWLGDTQIDLLKTEMDGIGRSKGIVTILTTNYPEKFPAALIDRPGRFHDVLKLDLPDETNRGKMLDRWAGEMPVKTKAAIIKATDGWSGAHIYELAHFAKTLQEQDGLELGESLTKAVDKINEQRELIDEAQLGGSHYRPRKEMLPILSKAIAGWKKKDPPAAPGQKWVRKLLAMSMGHCAAITVDPDASKLSIENAEKANGHLKSAVEQIDSWDKAMTLETTTSLDTDLNIKAGFLPAKHIKSLTKAMSHCSTGMDHDDATAHSKKYFKSALSCVKSVVDAMGTETGQAVDFKAAFNAMNKKRLSAAAANYKAIADDDAAHKDVKGYASAGHLAVKEMLGDDGQTGTDYTDDDGTEMDPSGSSGKPAKSGRVVSALNVKKITEAIGYGTKIKAHADATPGHKSMAKTAVKKLKAVLASNKPADVDPLADPDGDMQGVPTTGAENAGKMLDALARKALLSYGLEGDASDLETLYEAVSKARKDLRETLEGIEVNRQHAAEAAQMAELGLLETAQA